MSYVSVLVSRAVLRAVHTCVTKLIALKEVVSDFMAFRQSRLWR